MIVKKSGDFECYLSNNTMNMILDDFSKKEYLEITINKIKLNDKLFNSLLINIIGLGVYFFNPKDNLENNMYYLAEKILNKKNV